jgi:phosphoglycerate dehydrogenase-like enzyme
MNIISNLLNATWYHTLAPMLKGLGVRLLGYDPAVHHAAPIWGKLGVEPVPLNDLLARADAVSLQVVYASRFRGWINERLLNHCKSGQLWVGVSRSALFDPEALALALTDGRIDACLLDGANPAFAAEGTPLYNVPNLHLTPRLGSHTREAKLRASWYVAHRIHETLSPATAETKQSEFSELDSLNHPPDQDDPQAVLPSQWASLVVHHRR